MKQPSAKQIEAEAKKLAEMKTSVRHFTTFGDDNHAAIEIQIEVLKEDMSIEDIENRGDPDIAAEEELWNESQLEAALRARQWMDGEENESPSKSWEGLVGK